MPSEGSGPRNRRAAQARTAALAVVATGLVFRLAGPGPGRGASAHAGERTPEARAVAVLSAEVPLWARENHCFSCHNNGDAARALYEATRLDFRVPPEAVAETTAWLARPDGWDQNGGDGPFSDKRLGRVAFTAALAAATKVGANRDRRALEQAALSLAADQSEDGSWILEGEPSPGSPAAYSRNLATFLARESLAAADPARFRAAIGRADAWLRARDPATVGEAAVAMMLEAADPRSPTSGSRRRAAIALLGRAQSEDGGWGPYPTSPPEPFDTALALLGLARSGEAAGPVRRMIARGRAFLIAAQREDGSWPETTRPSGGTSYAQWVSTTGWATLALLATREASPR